MENQTYLSVNTTTSAATHTINSSEITTFAVPTMEATEEVEQRMPQLLTIDDILGQYWENTMARAIGLYGYPLIIIFGTIGNLLTLMVMLRQKMRRRPTCFHMSAIAVFDTLVLYSDCLRQWLALLHGSNALTLSSAACKVFHFFSYTFFDISVWLIVIMTVDRFLVVQFPLHAPKLSSLPRARKTVIMLIATMVLANLHFIWTVHLDDRHHCIYLEGFEYFHVNVWPWIDAAVYSFLPFILLLVFNILIIVIHRRSMKLRKTTLNINKPRTRSQSSNQGTQLRLSAMLFTVTFTFLLLSAPNVILICIRNTYFDFSMQVDDFRNIAVYRLVATLTMFCLYLNHAVNFLLYCISGRMFRKELWQIVKCKCGVTVARSSMFSVTTRAMRLSESSTQSCPEVCREPHTYI